MKQNKTNKNYLESVNILHMTAIYTKEKKRTNLYGI